MSPLERGFEALLRVQGENVTYRGAQVRALINRSPKQPQWNGPAKTGPQISCIVQFRSSITQPGVGNSFTDGQNLTHRIISVKPMVYCWECECSSHPTT